MKRISWSLAAGCVILLSGSAALLISAGVVKRVHAQAPTMDLPPPPSADLPPDAGAPAGTVTGAAPTVIPNNSATNVKPAVVTPGAPATINPNPRPQNMAAPAVSGQAAPNQPPPVQTTVPATNPAPENFPPPPDANAAISVPVPGPEGTGIPPTDSSPDFGLKTTNVEGYVYDPSGRRDPFFPPKGMFRGNEVGTSLPAPVTGPAHGLEGDAGLGNGDPLLTYYLRDFKLIGILWDVNDPKAMIRAPNNRIYTLKLKMKIGRENAVVAAIREKEIVLVEPDQSGNYKNGDARSMKMRN